MKKITWSSIKSMLLTYLTINKIIYWITTVSDLPGGDLANTVMVVVQRLMNQDLPLILGVVGFFLLDKRLEKVKLNMNYMQKYRALLEHILFYAIGLLMLLGILFLYNFVVSVLIFSTSTVGEFMRQFVEFAPTVLSMYVVVVVVLEGKQRFKGKEKEAPSEESNTLD